MALGLLLWCSYAYFVQGGGWNQNTRFALAAALAERGSLSIDGYASATGDRSSGVDGRLYTDKSPGPSWLAAPVVWLLDGGDLASAEPGPGDEPAGFNTLADRVGYLATVIVIGGPSALAGAVVWWLLCWLGAPRAWALALAVGYALGTMALPYATVFMNHQLAGALGVLAFALLQSRVGPAGQPLPPGNARCLLAGWLLGWAAICDYATLSIALCCGLQLLLRDRRIDRCLALVAGFLPPVLLFMAYNQACFGGPLTLGYQKEELGVWEDLAGSSVGFSTPRLDKLLAITCGRYRGLFWGSPFLLLLPLMAPVALWRLLRGERSPGGAGWAALGVVALFFVYNASFVYWHAGYAAGPRFLVPGLPFMVLLLARAPTALRALGYPLVALSVGLMLATTAVNPQVPGGHHDDSSGSLAHRWPYPQGYVSPGLQHYRDPWFEYTLAHLGAGRLGVNSQGLRDPLPRAPQDLVGQRASWSWGERAGLTGLWALAPLLGLWLAGLAVCWRLSAPLEPPPPPADPGPEPVMGWGRYPVTRARVRRGEQLAPLARDAQLARGLGRAYGDAALPAAEQDVVLETTLADRLLDLDPERGVLRAEAGVSLAALNRALLPRGWFTPVSPGTQQVTLGGMVAADVHGKNHHVAGTIGAHVRELELMLGSGERVRCGPAREPELFWATVGGMGLTGHILEVTLAMERVPSGWIWQESERVADLEAMVRGLREAAADWPMTVGWFDALARGSKLGRGILIKGRWATADEAPVEPPRPRPVRAIPIDFPALALNRLSMGAFNWAYYWKHSAPRRQAVVSPGTFFYPLDALHDWNRVYGKRGFTQHQCVLPCDGEVAPVRELLEAFQAAGGGSFLSVIKDCGPEGQGLLSFPRPGVSIALDFPVGPGTQAVVDALNRVVIARGGRIYLAKDALTRPEDLRAMEPRLPAFLEARRRWDPQGRLRSALSRRLFGDPS